MKKLFLLSLVILGSTSSVYGLSCVDYETFEDQLETTPIVVKGTIEEINFVANNEDENFCAHQGGNAVPGTYTYTISVHEVIKGDDRLAPEIMVLTREVHLVNCTRGGACTDMELGKSYTILTEDGETLGAGLCNECPYREVPTQTEPEMCICTMEYNPQCGIDGETYGNPCAAGCADVEIAYAGECEFGTPGTCDRGYSGPVCGADGISYNDICDLEDAGAAKAYDGFCVENPNPMGIVDAPNFCTSRYDGCNECSITNSIIGACTKRACVRQDRAKCTDFDFVYLTLSQQQLIESVVYKRLESATADDKNRVITKVANKIADIQYTLSVTRFATGSPALRNYQFALEVLRKIDSLF